MTAQEWFESVREYVLQIKADQDRLAAAREALVIHSTSGGNIAKSTYLDPTRHIDEYLDMSREIDKINADANQSISYAQCVVCAMRMLGANEAAAVIERRYLWGEDWDQIADRANHTARECRTLCRAAFRWIDSIGLTRLREIGSGECKSA